MDRVAGTIVAPRRPSSGIIAMALLAAIAVVAVVACDPAATGPGGSAAGPAASASSAPASAVASVAQDPPAAAIAAFVDRVSSGTLSYRMKFNGQVAASADVLPIAGAMDVDGTDFASSFTYDFDPEYPGIGKKKVQVRGVGDQGWIKRGSGAWKAIKGYGTDDSYVPFKGVTSVADVKYLGPADEGGSLVKVAIPGSLLIHPRTIPYEVQKEKVDSSTLELLIDAEGRPHSGTWHSVGQARVGSGIGQLQRIVYDLALTFSKLGEQLSIKRP